MGHRDRHSASLEDLSVLYQAKKMESIRHCVDSDVIYLLISDPEATELVTINEIHFIVDAIPSRRGRVRRTRDMTELFVCICGSRVEVQEQVIGSNTALRCGYDSEGCENHG
jgi:hypothetical protein